MRCTPCGAHVYICACKIVKGMLSCPIQLADHYTHAPSFPSSFHVLLSSTTSTTTQHIPFLFLSPHHTNENNKTLHSSPHQTNKQMTCTHFHTHHNIKLHMTQGRVVGLRVLLRLYPVLSQRAGESFLSHYLPCLHLCTLLSMWGPMHLYVRAYKEATPFPPPSNPDQPFIEINRPIFTQQHQTNHTGAQTARICAVLPLLHPRRQAVRACFFGASLLRCHNQSAP